MPQTRPPITDLEGLTLIISLIILVSCCPHNSLSRVDSHDAVNRPFSSPPLPHTIDVATLSETI